MAETKTNLFKKLEESRAKFEKVMNSIDINKIVYTDGSWRARDIMLNVAYWEYEGAKSLNAHAEGKEYFIPNFFERFNDINNETFLKFKDIDYSELQAYFDEGRKELIAAINRFNDEDLGKELMAFFGGKSAIDKFVLDLIDHEQKHLEDIVRD